MLAGLRAAGLKSQCVQEDATEGVRGGDNVLPVGAWYCSDVSDAEVGRVSLRRRVSLSRSACAQLPRGLPSVELGGGSEARESLALLRNGT